MDECDFPARKTQQ